MKLYNKITPEGTRDLLFEECEARRTVENIFDGSSLVARTYSAQGNLPT